MAARSLRKRCFGKGFYEVLSEREELGDQSDDEESISMDDDGVYEVERLIQKRIVKVICSILALYTL